MTDVAIDLDVIVDGRREVYFNGLPSKCLFCGDIEDDFVKFPFVASYDGHHRIRVVSMWRCPSCNAFIPIERNPSGSHSGAFIRIL